MTRRGTLAAVLLLAGCTDASKPERPPDFVIRFTGQSTTLDHTADLLLDRVAAVSRAAPDRSIVVAGYEDRSTTPQANQILSRIRAQIVADALLGRGVARHRMRLRPRAAIGGDAGEESRRVEIRFES